MLPSVSINLEQAGTGHDNTKAGKKRARYSRAMMIGIVVLVALVVVVGKTEKQSRQPVIDANIRIQSRHFSHGIATKGNIMGGSRVTIEQYPYTVAVFDKSIHGYLCAGVVVSPNTIMVPAHVVDAIPYWRVGDLEVVAGSSDAKNVGATTQVKAVVGSVKHEDYSGYTMANDMGLLHLGSPLTLNKYVQVANLPAFGATFSGMGTVVGWGDKARTTMGLQSVDVPIVSSSTCNNKYGGMIAVSVMMCAGTDGKGTCAGDSGAPLVVDVAGKKVVAGLTSWGHGTCDSAQFPTVYAKVSDFIAWIDANKW